MALYNDTVMEHFMNPHNVGEIENADGKGIYGSPVCGDMMQVTISVDENDKITDAKFKTFGCGSAIASSSMATDMIIGMTVEEAMPVLDKFMDNALLAKAPFVRIVHGMGTGALRKAVWDRLKKYNFIAKYEFAPSAQGGSGATIVTLKE